MGVARVGNSVKMGVGRVGSGVVRSGVDLGGKGVRSGVGRGGKGVSAWTFGRTGLAASMNGVQVTARIIPISSSAPHKRNQELEKAIVCPSIGISIWLNHIPKRPQHKSRRTMVSFGSCGCGPRSGDIKPGIRFYSWGHNALAFDDGHRLQPGRGAAADKIFAQQFGLGRVLKVVI